MRATTAGVLDRALDVAAALEVRGYGAARRPRRGGASRRPWSRHDLAFARRRGGDRRRWRSEPGSRASSRFESDPSLYAPVGTGERRGRGWRSSSCALLPFADRRGIER